MGSVFAYVVATDKLDPSEGIELSGEGVITEVEKMKADELKEITKKIKEAQKAAADLEVDENVDDDKSKDWLPNKGLRNFKSACVHPCIIPCFVWLFL